MRPPPQLSRIHSLDALRGLAALAVVFNHWKHFDNNTPPVGDVDRTGSPIYELARPFYEYGWIAVDLFFVISGFIFAYYYARAIREKQLGALNFFVRRISRLYPLFLVTTLIAGGLQLYSIARYGVGIVYLNTDFYHFVLSLSFASAWGLEAGPSFNGPSWSISVEMLLYGAFFVSALFLRSRPWRMLALMAAIMLGLAVQVTYSSYIGRGLTSFFLGWLVVDGLSARREGPVSALWAGGLLAMWGLTFAEGYSNILSGAIAALAANVVSPEQAASLSVLAVRFLMIFVLFPLTVMILVMLESDGKLKWTRRLGVVGDISYPAYLIHFPLQCVVILIAREAGWLPGYANNLFFMVAFFALLLGLSMLSAYRFEKPAQSWLRHVLSGSNKKDPKACS